MFKSIKKTDILLIILLVVIIALVAHFTLIARNQFFRFVYPMEAQLSKYSINCSVDAPLWMKQVLTFTSLKHGSLSNQLVYINPKGQSFHCENGWEGFPVFSKHIDKNVRYRYASLTKPITASLVLRLNAEKKLKLDDRLVRYFPELNTFKDERIREITIENLLTHTSGFDRLRSNDPLFNSYEKPWCPYNLSKLETLKLDHKPGQIYSYDNRNYCLLAIVVEKVTGRPFREIMVSSLPLKKDNILFIDGPFEGEEVGYDFRNENIFTENYIKEFDFKALSSVAGLSGSATAYTKLMQQLLNQKPSILSASTIDNHCQMHEIKSCFTLGLSQYQKKNHSVMVKWHDGGLPGVNSLFIYDEHGGITMWTGNGSPPKNTEEYAQFKLLYTNLNEYYHKKV